MQSIKLASGSPRRKEILETFHIKFEQIPHHFDETSLHPDEYANKVDYVKKLAYLKALSVVNHANDWVLTADTIVVYQNIVLNKPKNLEEACSFLKKLSNSTHQVLSAFCLKHANQKKSYIRCDVATLTFNKISEHDISHYVYTYSPLDKAGGYGIQELPKNFVHHIDGSRYTVIGLPIYQLKSVIKHIHNNSL